MNWSKSRELLEGLLCASLKGSISYNMTCYRWAHDDGDMASICVDGKDVFIASNLWYNQAFWIDYPKLYKEIGEYYLWCFTSHEVAKKFGNYTKNKFWQSVDRFLNQDIDTSLTSGDILENIFAVLDRRVGKRRLIRLYETYKSKNPIVIFFYFKRLEAEKIGMADFQGEQKTTK